MFDRHLGGGRGESALVPRIGTSIDKEIECA